MVKDTATDLIERVYDAALAEDGWPDLIQDLMGTFRGNRAALLTQDNRSGFARFHAQSTGITPEILDHYANYYAPRSPLFQVYRRKPVGKTYTDADYTDYERYRNSEIYTDFYDPLDAVHLLGVDLEHDAGRSTYLIIRRSRESGHFRAEDVTALDHVAPTCARRSSSASWWTTAGMPEQPPRACCKTSPGPPCWSTPLAASSP